MRRKYAGQRRDFWAVKDLETKQYACYTPSRPMFFAYELSAHRWAANRNDLVGWDRYLPVKVRLVEYREKK